MGVKRTGVLSATRAELTKSNKLDTPLGRTALALAARLDDPDTPGSAMANIAKELRSSMESLERGTAKAGDPVDELRERREQRLRRPNPA